MGRGGRGRAPGPHSRPAPPHNAAGFPAAVDVSRIGRALAASSRRAVRARAAAAKEGCDLSWRSKAPGDVRVLIVGSTGYIGRFVVKEMVSRGFDVTAVARSASGIGGKQTEADVKGDLEGARVAFGDCTDAASLDRALEGQEFDVVVSCLASRTGGVKDSWLIDYEATRNSMLVGQKHGAKHFVLLSAICVQKPLLEFQKAKLKFEDELIALPGMSYSIVRPTAFFKSVAGQVNGMMKGSPYVMFGDGTLAACKAISEADLAKYLADCVLDANQDLTNAILPIGGPGGALTAKAQADIVFKAAGVEPKFFPVPVGLMDGMIGIFDFLAGVFPQLEDSAEFAKIGKYYATESMLLMDPATGEYDADATPEYGETTLASFFEESVRNGGVGAGQELGDQAVF